MIRTKWIFQVKQKQDSSIERFKAHLVANDMRKVHDLNYLDSFSLVVQTLSMRLLLTLAVTKDWAIHQIDISNAFLHGTLEERIIVSQPLGFQDESHLDHACLLQKSLYGLKQSPRCWFQRLRQVLLKLGLAESRTDSSVFIGKIGSADVHLCVYINDILIASSSVDDITRLIKLLALEFPIRDLENLDFFMGILANRFTYGLHLSQGQYVANLLKSYDMVNVKPVVTPMVPNNDLTGEAREYRRIIGSLQYITLTRPDVQLSVNRLSQFMGKPNQVHWMAMKRVLCFLAGTLSHGILLRRMTDTGISTYCDANWDRDAADQKSRIGFLVYVGGSLVSWSSQKQMTMARSTTETEYRAIATTT